MSPLRPRPAKRVDHDEPLQRQIDTLRRQLHDLQEDSPTPDARAVRVRFEAIEGRLKVLEETLRVIHIAKAKSRAEAPNDPSAPSVQK